MTELRKIPPETRSALTDLRATSHWVNAVHLAATWGVVVAAAAAAYATRSPAVYVLAVVVIGSRQRGLVNLVHETSHHKLFRHRAVNDVVGRLVVGYPLLTPPPGYRCQHCRHHANLWDASKDPKAQRYDAIGLGDPSSVSPRRFLLKHVAGPLLLLHVPGTLVRTLSFREDSWRERVWVSLYWGTILTVSIATGTWLLLLLFWVVPYVTSFQVIRYWNDMADHAGLAGVDPWTTSRSWESNPVTEFFLRSFDAYHLLHHLFPGIPHYRMAKAHELLQDVPQYRDVPMCRGFFLPYRGGPSVMQDILSQGAARGLSPSEQPAGA